MSSEFQDFCAICGTKENLTYYYLGPEPARGRIASCKRYKDGREDDVVYRRACKQCQETITRPLAEHFGAYHPARVRKGFEKLSYDQLVAIVEIIKKKNENN